MRAGVKPLAYFPEEEAAALVADRQLLREDYWIDELAPDGRQIRLLHVYFALPAEAWRIPALRLIHSIYSGPSGWHPDLERVIGALLGYQPVDVEHFLQSVAQARR
ncbi:hypothetical protein [Zavarzinia sp.]|uniref:hypothetical protein n=1 Tax=Zavarzinia sp. TaxID=2027920 RepID=UPI003568AFFB